MSTFIGSSLRLNGAVANNSNQLAGYCAGAALTNGSHNNFFGFCAGRCNNGFNNNFFGCRAGGDNTGSHNNFFGLFAGGFLGGFATYNNAFGRGAGELLTTGNSNNFIGRQAGSSGTTGGYNNAFGYRAGGGNGFNNQFFGPSAGRQNTNGSNNVFIGSNAGYFNTTGCNNIGIGHNAGTPFLGNPQPVGFFSGSDSNIIMMGNASHNSALIQIGWTTVSDTRDKCIYGSIELGLGFLRGITPIEYQFKDRENDEITDPVRKRRYGFSAQEILELEGDHPVIISAEDPNKLRITTDHLLPVMVNAIKELAEKLEQQQQRIAALENIINSED